MLMVVMMMMMGVEVVVVVVVADGLDQPYHGGLHYRLPSLSLRYRSRSCSSEDNIGTSFSHESCHSLGYNACVSSLALEIVPS